MASMASSFSLISLTVPYTRFAQFLSSSSNLIWHRAETEIRHIKSRERERSNQKSHVQRRCLGDSCRPAMGIINAGARGREDCDVKCQDMAWYVIYTK